METIIASNALSSSHSDHFNGKTIFAIETFVCKSSLTYLQLVIAIRMLTVNSFLELAISISFQF